MGSSKIIMTGNSVIRFNSYESNLKQFIKKLGNEQSNYTDVTLAADDGAKFQAHKIILSAGSLFFHNIFKEMVHVQQPYIYLKGIYKEMLGNIVEFLYTGETAIQDKDVQRFLQNANDLQINGIVEDKIDNEKAQNLDEDDSKIVESKESALFEIEIQPSELPDVKLHEVEPECKVIEDDNVTTNEVEIENTEHREQKPFITEFDPDFVDEKMSTNGDSDAERQVLKEDSLKQKTARKNQWSDPYRLEMQRFPAEEDLCNGKLPVDQKVNAMIEKYEGLWKC